MSISLGQGYHSQYNHSMLKDCTVPEWLADVRETHGELSWRPSTHSRWPCAERARLRTMLVMAKSYPPRAKDDSELRAVHARACLSLLPEELLQLLHQFIVDTRIMPCSPSCAWASRQIDPQPIAGYTPTPLFTDLVPSSVWFRYTPHTFAHLEEVVASLTNSASTDLRIGDLYRIFQTFSNLGWRLVISLKHTLAAIVLANGIAQGEKARFDDAVQSLHEARHYPNLNLGPAPIMRPYLSNGFNFAMNSGGAMIDPPRGEASSYRAAPFLPQNMLQTRPGRRHTKANRHHRRDVHQQTMRYTSKQRKKEKHTRR